MQVGVEGSTAAANPRVFPNLPFLSFSLSSLSPSRPLLSLPFVWIALEAGSRAGRQGVGLGS